jgi:LmbE family N-acetylglucosaminyl deacetylase
VASGFWVYLSPHFDDIALSCGGLVWSQAQAGDQVSVWTVCAGKTPPDLLKKSESLSPFAASLHQRWQVGQEAVEIRRREDSASCQTMGAAHRHLPLPDCIYRQAGRDYWATRRRAAKAQASAPFLYDSEQALFGSLHHAEQPLVEQLGRFLAQEVPEQAQVVCPLALGGHVDHRLARAAAEQSGRRLLYYADYPYVLQQIETLDTLQGAGWKKHLTLLSPEALQAWQASIASHASQISTFWPNLEVMAQEIDRYGGLLGGGALWEASQDIDSNPEVH